MSLLQERLNRVFGRVTDAHRQREGFLVALLNASPGRIDIYFEFVADNDCTVVEDDAHADAEFNGFNVQFREDTCEALIDFFALAHYERVFADGYAA